MPNRVHMLSKAEGAYRYLCTGKLVTDTRAVSTWRSDVTCAACERRLAANARPSSRVPPRGGWEHVSPES